MLLERNGELVRVHGGATRTRNSSGGEEAPFAERSDVGSEAKSAMGLAAASLVRPGLTIIIDVGTTALAVAKALPRSFTGTVATCSLLAAAELAGRSGVEVLASGGRVRAGDLACSNAHAVSFFSDLRADIAFLGSGGIDASAGLTDFYLDEIATRKVILQNTVHSYVLADSAKFGRVAPHRVCGLEAIDGIITESCPDGALAAALDSAGAIVVTPPKQPEPRGSSLADNNDNAVPVEA